MNKIFRKLKNWLYYRTTNERLNDYVLTTVKPRFNSIRPKRKYKSAYSVIEEEPDTFLESERLRDNAAIVLWLGRQIFDL